MKIIIICMLLAMSSLATADCWYNGHMYPSGTVIGGLSCQPNGGWR